MNITNDSKCLGIDDVANGGWFYEKNWLIVGTGPSIEKYTPELRKEYNIWTINAAVSRTQYADICAIHDQVIYYDIKKFIPNDFDYRYILTRTPNLEKHKNTCYVQLECDTQYRDLGLPNYQRLNSSAFAFRFLGQRFKNIYTLGIDGGDKVSTLMPEYYQNHENGQNFNAHNGFIPIFQKEFGFNHIKL